MKLSGILKIVVILPGLSCSGGSLEMMLIMGIMWNLATAVSGLRQLSVLIVGCGSLTLLLSLCRVVVRGLGL